MTGQCPQEGPQVVAAQLPQPAPPSEVFPIFPAKADIIRCVRVDPHSGQVTVIFSSRLRKRTSKRCLHFRHLYSYIGIDSFLGAGADASVRLGKTSAPNLDSRGD